MGMNCAMKRFTIFIFLCMLTVTCDSFSNVYSSSPSNLRFTLKKFARPRHHISNPLGKEKARKFIKKSLRKSGLHVWSEPVYSIPQQPLINSQVRGENIIGMLKGKNTGTADDKIVIVGAHYDTTAKTKGVDDNGSGVTALLEAAKQIGEAHCKTENTIMFVAFDFEEDSAGYNYLIPFGSKWFVENLTSYLNKTGGSVQGALILEMLANHQPSKGSQHFPRGFSKVSQQAYQDVKNNSNRGNFLAVIGRWKTDRHLMEPLKKFYPNDENYRVQLVPIPLSGRPSQSPYDRHLRDFYRSDHYNFWENEVSFPAVMLTDTSNFRKDMDKCYHKSCDNMKKIKNNDLEFLRRNINAVIHTTLELSKAKADSCSFPNAPWACTYLFGDELEPDVMESDVLEPEVVLPEDVKSEAITPVTLNLTLQLVACIYCAMVAR